MKKTVFLLALLILSTISPVQADDGKATPKDVYDIVIKAYEVVNTLGENSFASFNDPKGEFVYKNTYVWVQRYPNEMMAHPFAMAKLKGVDLNKFPFNASICDAARQPGGGWMEYAWPKPGETKPSRKVTFAINVEGTPYLIAAGIYNDTDKVEDLNKSLR